MSSLVGLSAQARSHEGPAGLKWGKGPADAKSIFASRFEFLLERSGDINAYNTIEQYYTGVFANMEAQKIALKFHKGEFFYMAVSFSTSAAGDASRIWHDMVSKMTDAYGAPENLTRAPKINSSHAMVSRLSFEKHQGELQLLFDKEYKPGEPGHYELLDLLAKAGMWQPLAAWTFDNDVLVQVFVHGGNPEQPAENPLLPMWVFVKLDRMNAWIEEAQRLRAEGVRDY